MKTENKAIDKIEERELVITRIINAQRTKVFKAWIEPEQLAAWWGPKNFTNPVCELDVRPGGAILVHMRGPDGAVYPMKGTFHEITEPEKLVFTSTAFEDGNGNHMVEVLNTITFTEQNGKTELKLHAKVKVLKSTTEVEWGLGGMDAGWNQSLDRLDQLVKN